MKSFVVIVGVMIVAAPADAYESRYDHVDVESILNNRRMVNYYAACLLSKGPCPPQGVELKRILPEALLTNCAKCTEKQKVAAYRTIKRLRKEYPKIWDQLQAIWDPDNIYVTTFESSFESQKPTVAITPVLVVDRFGDTEDSASSASPPPSSTSTTKPTTTTKPTSTKKPTSSVILTRPPQPPPYAPVGSNLQATVTFTAALKNIVIQLYQLKLEIIQRLLSGR